MFTDYKRRAKQLIRKYLPIVEEIHKVHLASIYIQTLHKEYGKDLHVFLARGATGDIYIQFMLLPNYLKENRVENYLIVTDLDFVKNIAVLFPDVLQHLLLTDGYTAAAIEKAYMVLGGDALQLTVLFPWIKTFYVNRCRVRMLEGFHFIDSYRWFVLGLKEEPILEKAKFSTWNAQIEEKIKCHKIAKGKTVIISPEANSVSRLPAGFWNELIDICKNAGFQVLINGNSRANIYHAEQIWFLYKDAAEILQYAGYFIGIRSGLCDIISTISCRKIILYPAKPRRINYSEHRSDIEFCGLRNMGLVDDSDNLYEISTPLLMNITQTDLEISGYREYKENRKLLIREIMKAVMRE